MQNRIRILSLGVVALTLTGVAAFADVQVSVGWNPFSWWGPPPPPVVYAPPRYYAPPAVYYGHSHWGDQRDSRGHHDDHGRSEQNNGGEGRH
ncbi:MAG TPA: hypothetical protein VNZ02_15650 [Steroidobacteraceae bacterium]|jgi:hypothetical protein|nr:hypothetical protein [Steroidobacteraceae bacterium]